MFYLLKKINLVSYNLTKTTHLNLFNFFKKFYFLNYFFKLNDLIWQEGLLLDFLQKKSFDIWLKKFLIYSSYLFNERLIFDKITRFFLNLFILPAHKIFIFELNNVSNLLFFNIFFFILIFFLVCSSYLFMIVL